MGGGGKMVAVSMRSSMSVKGARRTCGAKRAGRGGAMFARADAGFIGSPTNLVMITTTSLALLAGRFGLAPSVSRQVLEPGLKLEDVSTGMKTGDPAGFTAVDTLALGSFGHAVGIGIVLGLKATGGIQENSRRDAIR